MSKIDIEVEPSTDEPNEPSVEIVNEPVIIVETPSGEESSELGEEVEEVKAEVEEQSYDIAALITLVDSHEARLSALETRPEPAVEVEVEGDNNDVEVEVEADDPPQKVPWTHRKFGFGGK